MDVAILSADSFVCNDAITFIAISTSSTSVIRTLIQNENVNAVGWAMVMLIHIFTQTEKVYSLMTIANNAALFPFLLHSNLVCSPMKTNETIVPTITKTH